KFLSKNKNKISIHFVFEFFRTMLDVFHEMGIRGINHGDLHAGNILVEDRSSYVLSGGRYTFRVTDFGVAEATSEPRFKDDYFQLADILAKLIQEVDYPKLSSRERYLYNAVRADFLDRHLVETDPTRDPIARQPG